MDEQDSIKDGFGEECPICKNPKKEFCEDCGWVCLSCEPWHYLLGTNAPNSDANIYD